MPQKKVTQRGIHKRTKHAAKHLMVPHKKNDFRPHLVRRRGLVFLMLLVAGLVGWSNLQRPVVLGEKTDVTQERLLAATNEQRQSEGLRSLTLDKRLNIAATLKAQDMLNDQYWSHEAPDGTTPWQWFQAAGYDYGYAGENLARGFHTAGGVVTAWMNSPEHRQNIMNSDYQDVGFAVLPGMLNGEHTSVVVAMYGAPKRGGEMTTAVLAATGESSSLMSRFGVGLQSMTPALLGSVVLLILGTGVALVAHAYRKRLPKPLRMSWRRHHGAYKAAGMVAVIIVLITLYGGGQI